MSFSSILKTIWTITLVVIGFFLGEFNLILQTFAVVILLDYASGILKAAYFKVCDSNTSYKGVLKKVSYFIVVALAHWIDVWTGSGDVFRNLTISLFIGTEGLSILENCYAMNKVMPTFLRDFLHKLFEKKTEMEKQKIKFL